MAGKLISKLYGGIDANATTLNIADNEAASIVNFDIGLDGSATRRLGTVLKANLGTPFCHLGKLTTSAGAEVYIAVAAAKVWRSTDNCATWTDITGSVTLTANSGYIGENFQFKYFIANGVDKPILVTDSGNAQTLEAASVLTDINTPTCTVTGAGNGQTWKYVVVAYSGRGETKSSSVATITTGWLPANLSATQYHTISWTPDLAATTHRIYAFFGTWIGMVGEVSGSTSTFNHTANTTLNTNTPPTANTAYMTPADWNLNGQPTGFKAIARGLNKRLLAFRGNAIWFSGQSDGTNWLGPSDAFVTTIGGALDNRISAIGNLFDYTLVFTRTNCFLFTGGDSTTWTMLKQVPVGCYSQNAIVTVGDDLYFPSQYGPTTMQRIVTGADVRNTTNFNNKIQPLWFATNKSYWEKIVGYVMPLNNRIVWWCPNTGATDNNYALVFQYDVGAWSSYNSWTPVSVAMAYDGTVYGGFTDGKVYQMHSGYSDNGVAISATYTTGHIDLNDWSPRKRIPWIDVVADRSVGDYNFTVSWSFDMGRQTAGPITCTSTTTGGSTVVNTSSTTTQHRVYTQGIGNTVQFTFSASTAGQNVKLIGYGTEAYPLGKRS